MPRIRTIQGDSDLVNVLDCRWSIRRVRPLNGDGYPQARLMPRNGLSRMGYLYLMQP